MNSRQNILVFLNEHIFELRESFSVKKIGLFGSYAAGIADANSDIDIAVEFYETNFDNYMDLKFYLEKVFNCPVDLVLLDNIKKRIKPKIAEELIYAEGL